MASRKYHLHDGIKGAAIAIRITPRASHNEIVEVLTDGTVKIRLMAPPIEGKANEALIQFLSDILDVPPSKIEIVAGATGRDKLVSVEDLDADTVHARILRNLG